MNIISELTKTTQCRFASFVYQAKGTGEIARHNLLLNVDTRKLYEKSLAILQAKFPTLSGIDRQACQELIDSLQESLEKGLGENSAYTLKNTLVPICNGIKLNQNDGSVLVTGFSRGKVVLELGEYKQVKSSAKTIAKNKLKSTLPISRIRSFCLGQDRIGMAKLNGNTLFFA